MRARWIAFVVCSPMLAVPGCTGASDGDGDGDPVPCESPLECEIGQACIDGVCTEPVDPVEPGEGEGEGDGDDREIIDGVCLRIAQCQGADPLSCSEELVRQIDEMRGIGTTVCLQAAEAMLQFFVCVRGLSCDQINNDPFSSCPVGNEASNLQSQCFNGSGEGEGEGECRVDEDCPAGLICFDGFCQ